MSEMVVLFLAGWFWGVVFAVIVLTIFWNRMKHTSSLVLDHFLRGYFTTCMAPERRRVFETLHREWCAYCGAHTPIAYECTCPEFRIIHEARSLPETPFP